MKFLNKRSKSSSKVGEDGFKPTFKSRIEPFLYLLPFIVGIIIFTIYPTINVFRYSFIDTLKHPLGKALSTECSLFLTNTTGNECSLNWGISNYQYVLQDKYFLNALKNTFIYVVTVVPVSTCLAIAFAYLLNAKIKFRGVFQTIYFLPMVTSSIAVGICWKYLLNYRYGFINYILNSFGISSVDWLGNASNNIWALVIFGIWSILPFTIILLLAGLQNIDELYYTAAKVDGAKPFKIFRRITLPLLRPTIALVLIINTISSFKVYSEIFPLFNGKAGITGNNLYTVVFYIYDQFFIQNKYGRASAAAIILFIIIFIFTMVQRKITERKY